MDSTLRELIASDYPWLLPTYDAYPYDTQRWDASRYAILHKYGGVYADLDLQPVRRIGALLEGQRLLLPRPTRARALVAARGRLVPCVGRGSLGDGGQEGVP